MILHNQAQAAAAKLVSEIAASSHDDLVLTGEKAAPDGAGWVFFYNTREYADTGNPMAALAGNGPVFVSANGDAHLLSSAKPWQDQI